MYDKTKDQLRKSFDNLAPDCLSAIKSAPITKIESEEILFSELEERKKQENHPWMWQVVSVAAIFLCVISVFFYGKMHVTATISVHDKSEVILSVNKSNDIVAVEVKDDPENQINPNDFKGKHLDEGLILALQAMQHSDKEKKGKINVVYHGNGKNDETRCLVHDISRQYSENTGCTINASDQAAKNEPSNNKKAFVPNKTTVLPNNSNGKKTVASVPKTNDSIPKNNYIVKKEEGEPKQKEEILISKKDSIPERNSSSAVDNPSEKNNSSIEKNLPTEEMNIEQDMNDSSMETEELETDLVAEEDPPTDSEEAYVEEDKDSCREYAAIDVMEVNQTDGNEEAKEEGKEEVSEDSSGLEESDPGESE